MDKIAPAFVKAQQGFAPALKTSTNPHFKSKYAGLDTCIDAVIDALHANGIALMQPTRECPDGVIVETLFLHESGQTMSGGVLHVPAIKSDPQGYGSALTYARRYSLMSACGIAPEDDDGNAATESKGRAAELPAAQQNTSPKARAQRIADGVKSGSVDAAASAIAGWPDALRNSVWALLDPDTRQKLTAAWPKAVV